MLLAFSFLMMFSAFLLIGGLISLSAQARYLTSVKSYFSVLRFELVPKKKWSTFFGAGATFSWFLKLTCFLFSSFSVKEASATVPSEDSLWK